MTTFTCSLPLYRSASLQALLSISTSSLPQPPLPPQMLRGKRECSYPRQLNYPFLVDFSTSYQRERKVPAVFSLANVF